MKNEITIKDVVSVSVLQRKYGTDIVTIMTKGTDAFPILNDPTAIRVDCQKGEGVNFCKNVLGVDPRVINDSTGFVTNGEYGDE